MDSPGTKITVIDDSPYSSGQSPTVPLILIATAQDKKLSDGSTAIGTKVENVEKVQTVTSQRELVELYGKPIFYKNQGTPLHGYELNEYGLMTAFQALGITSRVNVVRADIDLQQLEPEPNAPTKPARNGVYWHDTISTQFGIFYNDGKGTTTNTVFKSRKPYVIDLAFETQIVVLGEVSFPTNTSYDTVPTPEQTNVSLGGQLVINGTSITIGTNKNLLDICSAINNADIRGIKAVPYRIGQRSYLMVTNSTGNEIAFGNTSSVNLIQGLGLHFETTYNVVVPKSSYGAPGDFAVITLNEDNIIYQKLVPQNFYGQQDPLATSSWFVVGSRTWKMATPTVVIGNTAAQPTTPGHVLVINNTAVTLTGTGVAQAVQDINNAGIVNLVASTLSNALVLTNVMGETITVTNGVGGTALQNLGLYSKKGNELYYRTHAQIPQNSVPGDVWIKTTEYNKGAKYSIKQRDEFNNVWNSKTVPMFFKKQNETADDIATAKFGLSASAGTLYVEGNSAGTVDSPIASHVIKRWRGLQIVEAIGSVANPTTAAGKSIILVNSQNTINIVLTTINLNGQADLNEIVEQINNYTNFTAVTATTSNNRLKLTTPGSAINISGTALADIGMESGSYSNWEPLLYAAGPSEPRSAPDENILWYNPNFRVDIMVSDGDQWVPYRVYYPSTDPDGVQISASAPQFQSNGDPLVANDLWLNSSDLENYPLLYRYNSDAQMWELIDNTDQTQPTGIVFADARQDSGPKLTETDNYLAYSENIEDMLESFYVDPDTVDPRTYPAGLLLFNTRYSTYNVKRWKPTWFKSDPESTGTGFNDTDYESNSYNIGNTDLPPLDTDRVGRWVTASGNTIDGSPYMGRKAQRIMIVRSLAKSIADNEQLLSESVAYNLMLAPGYTELLDELVLLNVKRKETAFIITDTPIRLSSRSTEINNWAKNTKLAASNGDNGLTTAYPYAALYWGWGMSTDLDGVECVIPPSAIALHVYIRNDTVAYPWFPPAGFQRGLVENATMVGYLTAEDEFQPVLLNQGQRDILYINKINPIAFFPGRGLVVYGQKTLHSLQTALDRVNVARLICQMRVDLEIISKPFLFELNDKQTRDSVRITFERYLSELASKRALYDFLVICDETNNTPERIDRYELWIDIPIKPTRAIEFVNIPIRVLNTGDPMPSPSSL